MEDQSGGPLNTDIVNHSSMGNVEPIETFKQGDDKDV